MVIFTILFGAAGGIIYGLIAGKLCKSREPWFSIFMLLGLSMSIFVVSWLCGVLPMPAVWVLGGTGMFYIVLRLLFGKGSALEMFTFVHFCAVLILLFLPALERAWEKRHLLRGKMESSDGRVWATAKSAEKRLPVEQSVPSGGMGGGMWLRWSEGVFICDSYSKLRPKDGLEPGLS